MLTATYLMRTFSHANGLSASRPVRVKIIETHPKSYLVELLEPGAGGQPIGTTFRPLKRNIININGGEAPEIRLPYKN